MTNVLWPIATILLFVAPVWAVGTLLHLRVQPERIARALGPPSDPLTAGERTDALATRRCGLRLWREPLFGVFRFDWPRVTYPFARLTVLPGSLVLHLPRIGDYRFRSDRSTVQSATWGFWLAWYRTEGNTSRLRILVPRHRREIEAELGRAGWPVQR